MRGNPTPTRVFAVLVVVAVAVTGFALVKARHSQEHLQRTAAAGRHRHRRKSCKKSTTCHSKASHKTTSASGDPAQWRYLAAGDSYAAAPGVPSTSEDGGCRRSDHDYAHLLATKLGITHLDDVTCTGATPANTADSQRGSTPPQFKALDDHTNLVTVTLGVNQGGLFGGLTSGCASVRSDDPSGHPCEDRNDAATTTFNDLADAADDAVRDVLVQAHRLTPHGRVILIDYPRLAPSEGTCSALPFAAGDYPFVNGVIKRLDDDLRDAAAATGSDFIDLWKPSAGHDVCSSDPWVNGGSDTSDAIAYHPLPREQVAVADLIAKELAGQHV